MPEPRHARRRAQLPGLGLLPTCNRERTIKIRFGFCCVWLGRLKGDFPGHAMDLGLSPFFLRPFYCLYRVVNATPSIVNLAKFRMSHCQVLQGMRFIKSCLS